MNIDEIIVNFVKNYNMYDVDTSLTHAVIHEVLPTHKDCPYYRGKKCKINRQHLERNAIIEHLKKYPVNYLLNCCDYKYGLCSLGIEYNVPFYYRYKKDKLIELLKSKNIKPRVFFYMADLFLCNVKPLLKEANKSITRYETDKKAYDEAIDPYLYPVLKNIVMEYLM